MRGACTALIVVTLALQSADAQPAPFRQFIEAEDCELTDLKTYRNPLSSYIGDRFAYDMFTEPGSGTLSAPLRAAVPAGVVKVFVRVFVEGPRESRLMTVRLGGTQASFKYPTDQFDYKMNWLPFELETREPGGRIEIEVASPQGGRMIIDSVLVSTDPEDGAHFHNRRTRLLPRHEPPAELTARAAGEGNMLLNSGFEVAPTNGWRAGYQSQWALTEDLYDTDDPYEGDRCLRVQLMRNKRAPLVRQWFTYDGIYSAPVQVETRATYTASAYLRADGPVKGSIGLKGATERFELDDATQWQRVSATITAADEVARFYLNLTADEPRTVWLDAAHLQRGDLTDYSPGPGADVGLHCARPGRIWREHERVDLTWELRGREADTRVTLRYQIHDALGRLVARDEFAVQARAGQTARIPLHEGSHATGAFRIAYTVQAERALPYSGQACYSVIPAARGEGDGPVGLYASHSRQCFAAMGNAGIHWTNTLSPGGHFAEWTFVEPEKGHYVFHDDDIALAREFGIRFIANINTNRSRMPKWCLQDEPGEGEWIEHPMGYFSLAEWEEFCFALVEHYRDYVKHWLIIDEPDVGTNRYSPEDYAKMVKSAYTAAKRADPDSVVFAHTGTWWEWHDKVLAALPPEFFDAQYTYVGRFEREVGERLLAEAQGFNQPLWTVDFAPVRKLSTHYAAIDTAVIPPWDETAANTRKYDIWAIRSLSWGRAEKWFRYDARYPGPPPGTSYMSIWEHDGSLTPHGVSIATMNALIADAKPQGEVEMPEGMEGHLFAAGERKLLIAWTNDGTVRSLAAISRPRVGRASSPTVPLPEVLKQLVEFPGARAWDVYGGGLEAPLVGPLPTFIEFRGDLPRVQPQMVESIEAELLEPEAEGQPYRGRFVCQADGVATGEWVAEGPYFLERERAQRLPCQVGEDGRAELILPLNVWPNLAVRDRQAEVRLYLPGRMLAGVVTINTAPPQGP